MDQPLQVGITGGIGSGKTLVSRIFGCLGTSVYNADSRARHLMMTDATLIRQIKEAFGPGAYHGDGSLDRAFLGKQTFGQPDQLAKLNSLVHPRVRSDYEMWINPHKDQPYVLREAALLYETGIYKTIDKMIVVFSPAALRIERIKRRDPQRTLEQINAIMASQWPEEEKLKRADFIIYNDEHHMIIPQVLSLHQKFSS